MDSNFIDKDHFLPENLESEQLKDENISPKEPEKLNHTEKSCVEMSQNIGEKRKHVQDASYENEVHNNKKLKAKVSDVQLQKIEDSENILEMDLSDGNFIPVNL